ncbi:MAG: TonB-dependent receptor [Betaproteobacteria bacterium]|nr:TonB-dependent receptor [Betaproteobacteria bacterium]
MPIVRKSCYALMLSALPLSNGYADHMMIPSIDVTAESTSASITQPNIDVARTEIEKVSGGVTIVDAEQVREGRMSNYNDTLGMASGVFAQSRFGSEETRLSIRGSGLQRVFHGRGLKLMQDGIPVNLADGSFDFPAIDPYATSYIEVYRGANALQFGSSSLGGSVNFISPTGYTAPKFEVRSELGSFGYKRLGIQSGRVIDNLDYFVSLSGYDQNSFRDDADQDAQRLNGNIGYKINPNIETRFYFGYTKNDSQIPGNLTKYDQEHHPSRSQNGAYPGNPLLAQTGVWERNIDLWRIANKTTFRFENTQLELGAFYSKKDLDHPIIDLGMFSPFLPTLGVIDQKTDDYGLTAKLKHSGHLAELDNEFTIGITPTYGENKDRRYRNFNTHKGALTNDFSQTASNMEIFAEDRLYLTQDFSVIAGLQYTRSKRTARDKLIGVTGNESYSETYTQTSPKLGVLYQLQPQVQLFANVSRSFEPPSFGELINPATARTLKAQKGTTFEIGSRGNSTHVDWDVALYYAKLKDEMLAISPTAGSTDAFNADTIHQGLEMGMTARLPLHLEWRHSLLINHFRQDNNTSFGNNQLPGIPRSLLRAELLYRHDGFYAGPTFEISPQRYSVDYAETLYADSYTLLGLKVGQKVNEHWSWFLEGRNLTDEKYAASVETFRSAVEAGADTRRFLPGDGRSVYAGVTFRY